jgi:hypothetical protein
LCTTGAMICQTSQREAVGTEDDSMRVYISMESRHKHNIIGDCFREREQP